VGIVTIVRFDNLSRSTVTAENLGSKSSRRGGCSALMQEDAMSEESKIGITGVRTVSIPVTDQDRALEFYTRKLGFETRLDATFGEGQRWIEVAPAGSTTTIALVLPGPNESCGIDTGIRFSTGDAEADHAALQARGVSVGEILRWPAVPAMFFVRDPDDNVLRIIERMEESQTEGQHAADTRRFAILVKSDETTEAGTMPDEQGLAEMVRFNDEMADAGVMLAADGFHSSADGARVIFSDGAPQVVRGPFPEPSQLVAGYWIIQARSLEEAIDWMKRAPFGEGAEVEIRQVFEGEEFGDAYTPELREREERQRTKMEEANARRRAA
jgi:predicted enzyme related to lactoylglutathione lyase